jgi:hypothetical protein
MNSQYKISNFDKADNLLVDCGSFAGIVQAVVSGIIILCFISSGIIALKIKSTKEIVNAKILDATCETSPISNNNIVIENLTECVLDVEYKVEEEMFQSKLLTQDGIYRKGNDIKIEYDPFNPTDISYTPKFLKQKTVAFILFGIASLFLLSLILHIVLMKNSSWYKRLLCIGSVAQIVR